MMIGKAETGETILALSQVVHPITGRTVELLIYANQPQNKQAGPNAMIFWVPGEGLTEENMIDTTACPEIAKDLVNAVRPVSRAPASFLPQSHLRQTEAIVFDCGIYTVVFATHVDQIPAAQLRVPQEKRAEVHIDVLRGMEQAYGKGRGTYVVCNFNNREVVAQAAPIAVFYEKVACADDQLSYPGIDSHDGTAPRLGEPVAVKHWIIFGSQTQDHPEMLSVTYSNADKIPALLKALLPKFAMGKRFEGKMPNGDFIGSRSNMLAAGEVIVERGVVTA